MLLARKMLMGGAVQPIEVYGAQDTADSTSNYEQTSYTFPSVSLGTAHSDRVIWVAVVTWGDFSFSAVPDITGGTVGGQSLAIQSSVFGGASRMGAAFLSYQDNGSLGSSANVTINFSEEQFVSAIVLFTTNGPAGILDSYGDFGKSEDATPGSISTSEKGCSFYISMYNAGSDGTIDNFANDGSFEAGTNNEWVVYGFNSPETSGTTDVINPTGTTGTHDTVIHAISMEPT